MIPGGNYDELRRLKDTLRIARFNTLCQYCKELFHAYKDNENFKVASDFIQKTKQYLSRRIVITKQGVTAQPKSLIVP